MKRPTYAIIVMLLLFVMFFTSSCNFPWDQSNPTPPSGGSSTTQQVFTCLGDILVKVLASVASDDAPLTIASFLSVAPECISAAVAAFSAPPNTNPSSPVVTINTAPLDGSSSGSVNSNPWRNCTDYKETLTFNFSVPFAVIVGPQNSQESFSSSPGGNSDDDLVAQQLFQQYGDHISSITNGSGTPSQSLEVTVFAHSQITLTLPILQSYKEGEAQIVHTDGSITEIPWLFTDGYQQNGQITYSVSGC